MDQSVACEAAETALKAPSDQSLRVACYCEENVWRLAYRRLKSNPKSTYHIVFVSNEQKCVAMWYQMTGKDGGAVFWDYHVLLVETTPDHETLVLDMDSQLPYPCPFQEYVEDTFLEVMGKYTPLFRIVEASEYLKYFSSDRSHMYNQITKTWSSPPPDYACIHGTDGPATNLSEYITMVEPKGAMRQRTELQMLAKDRFGKTMTLTELQEFFDT